MTYEDLNIYTSSTMAEVLTAIKKLKYPTLSLALAVCVGFLFLLFSFAEDKAPAHHNNRNRAAFSSSTHWETDFTNNESYTYAQWHYIHF